MKTRSELLRTLFLMWSCAATMFLLFTAVPLITWSVYYAEHRLAILNGTSGLLLVVLSVVYGTGMGLVFSLWVVATIPRACPAAELEKMTEGAREVMLYWNLAGLSYVVVRLLWRKLVYCCEGITFLYSRMFTIESEDT